MGRFFSNIHIKKDIQQTKDEFIEQIKNVMEQQGFVSTTEQDGTSKYYLYFCQSNSWVTVTADLFQSLPAEVSSVSKKFAGSLQTPCFSTDVVDSDFAILELYNATSTLSDTVIVGDGSGYGFKKSNENSGNRKQWEPLLTKDYS